MRRNAPTPISPDRLNQILSLWCAGMSARTMSAELGLPTSRILRLVARIAKITNCEKGSVELRIHNPKVLADIYLEWLRRLHQDNDRSYRAKLAFRPQPTEEIDAEILEPSCRELLRRLVVNHDFMHNGDPVPERLIEEMRAA